MTNSSDPRHPSRRDLLARLAAAVAGGLTVSQAFAQDAALQALIDQNQGADFGQGFDSASRTIQMPKASLPTLSPETVQHTEQAIAQFEGIVARGGWPEIAQSDRLRLGARHPAVTALRKRLMISGDLDSHAGVSDI
jgi:murein L,D-transpeptidase YcbB/YkuD